MRAVPIFSIFSVCNGLCAALRYRGIRAGLNAYAFKPALCIANLMIPFEQNAYVYLLPQYRFRRILGTVSCEFIIRISLGLLAVRYLYDLCIFDRVAKQFFIVRDLFLARFASADRGLCCRAFGEKYRTAVLERFDRSIVCADFF